MVFGFCLQRAIRISSCLTQRGLSGYEAIRNGTQHGIGFTSRGQLITEALPLPPLANANHANAIRLQYAPDMVFQILAEPDQAFTRPRAHLGCAGISTNRIIRFHHMGATSAPDRKRKYEMGLFNFWKKSGKKVADEPTSEALQKEVADLGLDAKGLDITVEGDKVKIKGNAVSKEVREKVILAVGNVSGVAEVEDDSADDAMFHTVEKGDNLSAIAKKTLGSANRYMEIFEANRPMLSDPDKIYPGQVLRIPQDTES